jgi:hypothetical protein
VESYIIHNTAILYRMYYWLHVILHSNFCILLIICCVGIWGVVIIVIVIVIVESSNSNLYFCTKLYFVCGGHLGCSVVVIVIVIECGVGHMPRICDLGHLNIPSRSYISCYLCECLVLVPVALLDLQPA